jgi:hypothetical protein
MSAAAPSLAAHPDAELPAALREPIRRVGPAFVALLSVASLGLWSGFFTPIQVLLPLQLQGIDPVNKIADLSIGGYSTLYALTDGVTLLGAVFVQPIRSVR